MTIAITIGGEETQNASKRNANEGRNEMQLTFLIVIDETTICNRSPASIYPFQLFQAIQPVCKAASVGTEWGGEWCGGEC